MVLLYGLQSLHLSPTKLTKMTTVLKLTSQLKNSDNCIVLLNKELKGSKSITLTKEQLSYINDQLFKNKKSTASINLFTHVLLFQKVENKSNDAVTLEGIRKSGADAIATFNQREIREVTILSTIDNASYELAFAEGMALGNYQFLKYKTGNAAKPNSLKEINIKGACTQKQIDEQNILIDAVYQTRTLVNEPVNFLTAVQLSKEIEKMGKKAGFKTEVFNKRKIEALKMGGLIAVNLGSVDPPTFSVLEYKPAKAKNKKPLILVGKGVVYDTGGLSLKPTPNSMDYMKSDMGGAAAVTGAMYAIAKAKLPVHVIGLIPATDNRPGGNAYTPGDVITMHSGQTVEVLNTDAEGRMILADALSYAKKYKPELVIDLATLTGAAVVAVGAIGIAAMSNDEGKINSLKKAGANVHERLVELPLWDEYAELIKSDIADMKNIGGPTAGTITAGKFLEKYTDYPWIHLDIAGPAFLQGKDGYKTKGGTGVGVRLLFEFAKNHFVK